MIAWSAFIALFPLLLGGLSVAGLLFFGLSNLATVQAELPSIGSVISETEANLQAGGPQIVAFKTDNPLAKPANVNEAEWQALDSRFLRFGQLSDESSWVEYEALPSSSQAALIMAQDLAFWDRSSQSWSDIFLQALGLRERAEPSPILTYLIENDPALEAAREQLAVASGLALPAPLQRTILSKLLLDTYNRNDLANWYLNRAYFGHLRFGVEEAARFYFDQSAVDLDLPRAAMLAAIPFDPESNPIAFPVRAKLAQEEVLEALLRNNFIQQDQFVAARFTPLPENGFYDLNSDLSTADFVLVTLSESESLIGPYKTRFEQAIIYTTLNLNLQAQLNCTLQIQLDYLAGLITSQDASNCAANEWLLPPDNQQAGRWQNADTAIAMVIDPTSGFVQGLASRGNAEELSNLARNRSLQPGPALMPITYLTALAQRFPLSTMLLDVPYDFGTPFNGTEYLPTPFLDQYRGPISMREGLLSQSKAATAHLLSKIGPQNVFLIAQDLGVSIDSIGETTTTELAIHEQGGKVSVEEMTFAYATLANGGISAGRKGAIGELENNLSQAVPIYILAMEDHTGLFSYTLDESLTQSQQVVTPDLVYLLTDALSDAETRCEGRCPALLELPGNRPAALHYGITSDLRDSWALGYTPQIAIGVWVGNSNREPSVSPSAEITALPVWRAIISYSLENLPIVARERPGQITEQVICYPSGLLPTDLCAKETELFIAGTSPIRFDDMAQEISINRETGLLSTPNTPLDLVQNKNYLIYPPEAETWVIENNIPQPPTEYDTLRVPKSPDGIEVRSPRPLETVSEPFLIKVDISSDEYQSLRIAWHQDFSNSNLFTLAESIPLRVGSNQTLFRIEPEDLDSGLVTLILTFAREDNSIAEVPISLLIESMPE